MNSKDVCHNFDFLHNLIIKNAYILLIKILTKVLFNICRQPTPGRVCFWLLCGKLFTEHSFLLLILVKNITDLMTINTIETCLVCVPIMGL